MPGCMDRVIMLKPDVIYQGDARQLLSLVAPASIDCSFWSPPYHVGKQYESGLSYDDWTALLSEVIHSHFAIMKPGGFLVINIADILAFPDPEIPRFQAQNLTRQTSAVTREDVVRAQENHPGFSRQQLADLLNCSEQTIDRRLHGNNIRGGKYNTQTRVLLTGALIETAGMAAGFYLYDRRIWVKDPAWQSSKWHSSSYRAVDEFEYLYVFWKPGATVIDRNRITSPEWSEWGSRAVWYIPSVRKNDDHEAKFPLELARRVIRLFSPADGVILDCFIGSGTTAVAAIETGRHYIGMELQPEYVSLAQRNCKIAEVQQRQLSLFTEGSDHAEAE